MAEVKSALIGLIERYEELRALKDELSEATKEINEEYKKIQEEIVEQMVDDDIPSQGYGDYSYSPQTVTHYSFISEESLAEKGIDKMEFMEMQIDEPKYVDMEALDKVMNNPAWKDNVYQNVPPYNKEMSQLMVDECSKFLLGTDSLDNTIASLVKNGTQMMKDKAGN